MKVLVTGGRGMIGRVVTNRLLRSGYAVVSADRSLPDGRPPEASEHQVVCDVTDAGEVWPLVAGQDAVVHLAGIPEAGTMPDAAVLGTNVLGAYHVLSAARALGVRTVVQASSATLLGFDGRTRPPVRYLPVDEKHPVATANVYSLSKALSEDVARHTVGLSAALRIWSLRLTLVLGPENWEREGLPRLGDPERGMRHLFAYVWVDDVADAIERCLVADPGGVGHDAVFVSGPDVLAYEPGDRLRERFFPHIPWTGGPSFVCTDLARDLLDFVPRRSWRDAQAPRASGGEA